MEIRSLRLRSFLTRTSVALPTGLFVLFTFFVLFCRPDEEDGRRVRETGDTRLRERRLPVQEELLQNAAGISANPCTHEAYAPSAPIIYVEMYHTPFSSPLISER